MKITEKRTAHAKQIKRLFDEMGWFDKEPKKSSYVALSLEMNSANGITADNLYLAALYVEQYTDENVLNDIGTFEIMAIIDRECSTVFSGEPETYGPRGL